MTDVPGSESIRHSLRKSAPGTWVERDKIRAVEVSSPLPPDECIRRLAKVTTTRKNGWYLDPRTATLPDPLFHGTVGSSQARIALFKDMLGRHGSEYPVWFDVQVGPGPDGGTLMAGTVGSRTASANAVASLVFVAVFSALALFFFVLGVVITASGHFDFAVGAAIGVPLIGAASVLAARDSLTLKGEGRVPPLLRTLCVVLDATSVSLLQRPRYRAGMAAAPR
jgi:hypothetical protein